MDRSARKGKASPLCSAADGAVVDRRRTWPAFTDSVNCEWVPHWNSVAVRVWNTDINTTAMMTHKIIFLTMSFKVLAPDRNGQRLKNPDK
jgi:hypothetical protein